MGAAFYWGNGNPFSGREKGAEYAILRHGDLHNMVGFSPQNEALACGHVCLLQSKVTSKKASKLCGSMLPLLSLAVELMQENAEAKVVSRESRQQLGQRSSLANRCSPHWACTHLY